jgi:hypothetical protein
MSREPGAIRRQYANKRAACAWGWGGSDKPGFEWWYTSGPVSVSRGGGGVLLGGEIHVYYNKGSIDVHCRCHNLLLFFRV